MEITWRVTSWDREGGEWKKATEIKKHNRQVQNRWGWGLRIVWEMQKPKNSYA